MYWMLWCIVYMLALTQLYSTCILTDKVAKQGITIIIKKIPFEVIFCYSGL